MISQKRNAAGRYTRDAAVKLMGMYRVSKLAQLRKAVEQDDL